MRHLLSVSLQQLKQSSTSSIVQQIINITTMNEQVNVLGLIHEHVEMCFSILFQD